MKDELTTLLPGLSALWRQSTGDPRVCVAIVDGPVDRSHECFKGSALAVVETMTSGALSQGPAGRHGTHVASIIFGQHGSSFSGIAPGCRGLSLAVFEDDRENGGIRNTSQLDLARAITQAVAAGAQIVNVSGGQLTPNPEPESYLAKAIQLCTDNGVLVVAAAGNDGCDCVHIPAAAPAVLAVGAVDRQGSPLAFSNWGAAYRTKGIAAPGDDIPGAMPGGGVDYRSGTSYATPLVSGIAALLLSVQLKYEQKPDPYAVRDAILRSAWPCDGSAVADCNRLLAGTLNVEGAFRALNLTKPSKRNKGESFSMSVETINNTEASLALADAETAQPNAAPAASASPLPGSGGIRASDCGCGGNKQATPSLVYALGHLGYDFGTEARRDAFHNAAQPNNIHSAAEMAAFLGKQAAWSESLIWTLNHESTPIYAIHPTGSFAGGTYENLRETLLAQHAPNEKDRVTRVGIAGQISGSATLLNGQVVPVIVPDPRFLGSWSVGRLVASVVAAVKTPGAKGETKNEEAVTSAVANFLQRVYYDYSNLGVAPQDRALNYAATNAFQATRIFKAAIDGQMRLSSIEPPERSPICRPGSECWDVKLVFFNPSKRFEQAKHIYKFTVDVSDVLPVLVGEVRDWEVA